MEDSSPCTGEVPHSSTAGACSGACSEGPCWGSQGVLVGSTSVVDPAEREGDYTHFILAQQPTDTTSNQNSLFMSRDWLSANQGPVFPGSVGLVPGGY